MTKEEISYIRTMAAALVLQGMSGSDAITRAKKSWKTRQEAERTIDQLMPDKQEGNGYALLVAAAPELLEALELLEMCLRHAEEGGHLYAPIDTKGAIACAARAAIAKT